MSTYAMKKHVRGLNKSLKKQGRSEVFNYMQLTNVFQHFKGRCAYCGVGVSPNYSRFHWYIPLDKGGKADTDNLILVCNKDAERYRHARRQRETIPDVNTFGDLVHNLVQTTILTHRLKSDNNIEAFKWEEKSNRLKRAINGLLEEIVNNLHYRPFTDWEVENVVFEEDINTIPDVIEDIVVEEIEQKPVEKEKLNDAVKQILTTKQYKIIKHEADSSD